MFSAMPTARQEPAQHGAPEAEHPDTIETRLWLEEHEWLYGLLRSSDMVRFVPAADFSGTATITYRAWDRSSGTVGSTADLSTATSYGANLQTSNSGSIIWLIIRKPDTSMPSVRAASICCFETSASVQCVAMRTERTPRS